MSMNGASRSLAVVAVGVLVVLAGCSVLAPGGTLEESTPGQTTSDADTGGEQGTPTASPTATEAATSTPTPTPDAEPTPTPDPDTGLLVAEVSAEGDTLYDEYLVFQNAGDLPLDLSGWRVKDEDGNTHTFGDGVELGNGESLALHSSKGTQTESDRFWWADSEVWDDGGETIYVYDERGQMVYEYTYS